MPNLWVRISCGIYPNEPEFVKKLEEEAVFRIKRQRNHPSLALWAGDNECDTIKRFSDDKVVISGTCAVPADAAVQINSIGIAENEEFYYIEWTSGEKTCHNHSFANIVDIDYGSYMKALQKYGMDEFEGF